MLGIGLELTWTEQTTDKTNGYRARVMASQAQCGTRVSWL